MIDLDDFKNINDSMGHVVGDRLLVEIASRIQRSMPDGSILARIGGDEFGFILNDDVAWDLEQTAEEVLASIRQPVTGMGYTVRTSASIGLARCTSANNIGATELVERADFALYEAKKLNRGTWILFADEHEAVMREQNVIESTLRHADLDAELRLFFQPIVDVRLRRTAAFEALARWRSPILGNVPPNKFISASERIGLINDVTLVLFRKALAALALWPAHITLSFNLSMADITSVDAISRLCDLIDESKADPLRIQFEVTETAMLLDFERAYSNLLRLKEIGVSLALDDFGTGYSSLSHVHRLPVDKLKIDQSFTKEMAANASARNIVASIIGLAHNLKLESVVEGVETAAQAIQLQAYGCRFLQGYLFSKPIAEEDVAVYLDVEDASSKPSRAQTSVLRLAGIAT